MVNITKVELKQYRSLKQELIELTANIRNHETTNIVVGSSKNFPYIKQHFKVVGTDESDDEVKELLSKRHKIVKRIKRIEKFIDDIEDSETRRIFSYRYLDGKVRPSWQWIAFKIGGNNSADAVRKRAYRYIENKK